MRFPRTTVLCILALFVSGNSRYDVHAQTPSAADESTAVDTGFGEIEEIIVRGRSLGELLFEIRRSEEAVFTRFNDINSTDAFDFHCRVVKSGHSRVRSCQSNFANELSGKIGTEMARAIRGAGSPGLIELYSAEGRSLQRRLDAEMRQLATEDEQLAEAIAELSQAQFALTLARGKTTLSREVSAASGSLPYGAERMFEIIMGVHPFRHRLTRQTFTIADVLGEIRKLDVECTEGRQRIDYESGVDWTVPTGWSACTLQVGAKRETTFRLYEF